MNTRNRRILATALSSTILASAAFSAVAQESANNGAIEEIVVTATKIGETSLQDTPLSVTAFTGDMLKEGFLDDITAISDFTPGLQVSANANIAQVTIRGIGSNTTLSGGETSSTIQIDGVYVARPSTNLNDFLDVARIEVLRGPQGTLYGRNATGGTINIITNEPGNEAEFSGDVSYGSHNYLRLEAVASGALVQDKMFARLAVRKHDMDGFVRSVSPGVPGKIGEEDRFQLQGKLKFVGSDRLSFTLAADYTDINETPLYYTKPLAPTFLGEAQFNSLHTVALSFLPLHEQEIFGISGTIKFDLSDAVTLTSITAYRESDMSISADLDATEVPFIRTNPLPEDQDQISQELLLNYSSEQLDLVGGLYYLEEDVESFFFLKIFPAGIGQMQGRDAQTKAYAIFGQGTYDINSKLSVTAGLRYTKDDKDGRAYGGIYGILDGPADGGNPVPAFENFESAKFNALTPKFGVDYRPNEDMLVYASATRGYKAGGFNFIAAPGEDGRFDEETVWAYEIGLKSTLADGRMNLNVAAFYNNYNDLQVIEFIGAGVERVRNATGVDIKGLEVEVIAKPSPRFTLMGSLAYLDSTYDGTFLVAGGTIDADGNRTNNAPKWSGSLIGHYDMPLAGGTLTMRGELAYRSEVFFGPANDNFQHQGSYALLNARVAYEPENERWTAAVNVRNLTDKEYLTGAAAFIGPVGRPGQDRMVIGSLGVRF